MTSLSLLSTGGRGGVGGVGRGGGVADVEVRAGAVGGGIDTDEAASRPGLGPGLEPELDDEENGAGGTGGCVLVLWLVLWSMESLVAVFRREASTRIADM